MERRSFMRSMNRVVARTDSFERRHYLEITNMAKKLRGIRRTCRINLKE